MSTRNLNPVILADALELASETLRNIEMSELPLGQVALKASRLARLLGDADTQRMMALEAGGYSSGTGPIPAGDFALGLRAGRQTTGWDRQGQMSSNLIWVESIEQLEAQVEANRITLQTTHGAAAPPATYATVITPPTERGLASNAMAAAAGRVASRRRLIHDYVSRTFQELKYSGIASDIFARIRSRVDMSIGSTVPEAVSKLSSVYENLRSSNEEDWSNAAHSCRRILQDLADRLYPPTEETRTIEKGGGTITVRYGRDQYVNRLIAYVESRSESARSREVVGSHLAFLGDRLDALFGAAQKGSHSTVGQEEADRYVVYTYLLVGDILSL